MAENDHNPQESGESRELCQIHQVSQHYKLPGVHQLVSHMPNTNITITITTNLNTNTVSGITTNLTTLSPLLHSKAILTLLEQLTSFGQRESLTIHASSGSGRMSAVSSAQSIDMLQSVAARWRRTK